MRRLLDMSFVGIAIFNARTQRWVRFNERFCSIVGYTSAELTRLSWDEISHPEDAVQGAQSLDRLVRQHSQHERLTHRLVHKDGSVVTVDIDASDVKPRSNPDHFIIALVTPAQDKQVAKPDARYRILWDSCNIPVVLVDTDSWEIVDANPAAQAFYGAASDRLKGAGLAAWSVRSSDPGSVRAHLSQAASGAVTHFEVMHRVADGSTRDVEIYCGSANMESRHILYCVIHDITARKGLERKLVESERRFRAMLEQPIAAVLMIQDDKIVYVNPRMREIFGYGADEPFDRNPLSHVSPADRPRVIELQELRRKGVRGESALTVRSLRKDGSEFPLGIHSTLASFQGKPAVIAIAKDISDSVRAEESARLHTMALERAMQSTIEVVSMIGELRDPYTHGHERRVGALAAAIAVEIGLDDNRVEGIRVAGYLHDIGKIGIPAELLSKPTRLSPAEFALIKGHAQQGYEILKGVDFPWPVALAALQHHERLDGGGYPQGLKGDAIILEARILAVADVIEAMSSHRPYRAGLGIDKALAEVERGSGSAYDPTVAAACARLFKEKGFVLPA